MLLDRLTAPADLTRQYLELQRQNPTLGLGAEIGVRELLGLVLPKRLAVTSGFVRSLGFDLQQITPYGGVSPQTDVIVHDASQAVPLHSLGAVEVVAAPDVLAVFEVKDTQAGSDDLGPDRDKALPHVARIAAFTPLDALRGIVLFQGKQKTSQPEIEIARERFEDLKLKSFQVPHVVYCTSFATSSGQGSYLVFHDALSQAIRFYEHAGDRTASLAGFLRIVTGFFAVRGLTSPSLHLDLHTNKPSFSVPYLLLADAVQPFERLHAHLARSSPSSYEERFAQIVEKADLQSVFCHVTTGCDAEGLPTAGFLIQVQWRDVAKPIAAAFFYLQAPGVFACTDALGEEPWTIEREQVDAYVTRVLGSVKRADLYNKALRPELTTPITVGPPVAPDAEPT